MPHPHPSSPPPGSSLYQICFPVCLFSFHLLPLTPSISLSDRFLFPSWPFCAFLFTALFLLLSTHFPHIWGPQTWLLLASVVHSIIIVLLEPCVVPISQTCRHRSALEHALAFLDALCSWRYKFIAAPVEGGFQLPKCASCWS